MRAGHASVGFTLDRYEHLYPEADTTLRDRLEALDSAARLPDGGGHPAATVDLRPQRGRNTWRALPAGSR